NKHKQILAVKSGQISGLNDLAGDRPLEHYTRKCLTEIYPDIPRWSFPSMGYSSLAPPIALGASLATCLAVEVLQLMHVTPH
ncbi:hypothetical protein M5D96_012207, partial [Drosophila gunungcola]